MSPEGSMIPGELTYRIFAIEIWVFNHFLPFRSYRYFTSILSSRIDLTSFFPSFSPILFYFQQKSSVFIKFLKILNRTIFISSYEVLFDFFWLFVWFFDFIESFVFVWCQTWCVLSYEPHERKVTRTYTPSYYRIRTFIWIKTGLLKVRDFLSKLAANWKKEVINNQYFQRSHWRTEIRLRCVFAQKLGNILNEIRIFPRSSLLWPLQSMNPLKSTLYWLAIRKSKRHFRSFQISSNKDAFNSIRNSAID